MVLIGCTPYGSRVVVEPERPSLDGVLRIVGRFGIYSACPFDDGLFAFTSAHAVDIWPEDKSQPLLGGRWEDGYGNSGTAEPLAAYSHSDLALIKRLDGRVCAGQAFPGRAP